MRKIQILGNLAFIGFMAVGSSYASNTGRDDFDLDSSYTVFLRQTTYATKDQVLQAFNSLSHLTPGAREYGIQGIEIMFRPDFPQPKHSWKLVNKGWKCLMNRLQDAYSFEDQKDALDQTLALHIKSIKDKDLEFSEKISGFPCDACKNTALKENGIDTNEIDTHSSYNTTEDLQDQF